MSFFRNIGTFYFGPRESSFGGWWEKKIDKEKKGKKTLVGFVCRREWRSWRISGRLIGDWWKINIWRKSVLRGVKNILCCMEVGATICSVILGAAIDTHALPPSVTSPISAPIRGSTSSSRWTSSISLNSIFVRVLGYQHRVRCTRMCVTRYRLLRPIV